MSAVWWVLPGMAVALGCWLIVASFRPQHVRLGDALAALADTAPVEPDAPADGERLGAWWIARRAIVSNPTLERRLHLRGRTLARHYTLKLAWASGGFVAPFVAGLAWWVMTGDAPALPMLFSLVGAGVGFVLPDVLLRQAADEVSSDATEALLTFFDLVTLERLANQSATSALHAAASVSDATIFATIRSALERARLQQRLPFAELAATGRRLELPALVDLADVMRLDESGASLSGALRSRVKELRDAHLTATKLAAAEISERMTLFMVVPSLIFGLIFLVPPLLRLLSS